MTTPLQVLYFMAVTIAPPGTHHITVTAGSETYLWDADGKTWHADSNQIKADSCPENALETNMIVPDSMKGHDMVPLKLISHHDWQRQPILRFDEAHQLESNPEGFVYVVRPGSPNQKSYSFLFSK